MPAEVARFPRRARFGVVVGLVALATSVVPAVEASGAGSARVPACTIAGTPGPDVLVGGPGRDVICGFGGNDRLFGAGGDDVLRGGPGDDLLRGGPGDDVLRGGPGQDVLRGDSGDDTLYGGAGADLVHGGSGSDDVRGGRGDDAVRGGSGDDVVRGGRGDDDVRGGYGDDELVGGPGDDRLSGGPGRDLLSTVDGFPDVLGCGAGTDDSALADAVDSVAASCEHNSQNIAPVAVNDTATATEDTLLSLPVSGAASPAVNDTDADGDALTVVAVSGAHGGAVAVVAGTIRFTPTADLCGVAAGRFDYTVSDGKGGTDVGRVTVDITCVPDNPTAVDDLGMVQEDASATALDVLANDGDADGDPLQITSVSQPANGTVAITGGGTGLTYEPDPNYCNQPPGTSPDTFTYALTPGGSTATVSMLVLCVDDAPVAVDDTATVAQDDAATPIAVLSNDTDIDGGPKTIASASDPANGTVVLTGGVPGAHTGLTYQPDASYCNDPPGTAPDTFTYTLNGGDSATVSVLVTCPDAPPTAVGDSATVSEGSGASAIDVLANDTDSDGGPKAIASASDPANGTVVLTGGVPGAATGLTYQPDPSYCNDPPGTTPDTFTYTLNGGSTATVSVTVTCVDNAPVAVNDSATVTEDAGATAVVVLANDTDIDGGPKTIASASDPANGTVVLTGGVPGAATGLTYQPDPNYCNDPPGTTPDTFTYTLNGGSTATVSVTVTCVNDAPVADNETFTGASSAIGNTSLIVDDPTDGAPTLATPSKTVSGDILAGDTDVDGPGPLAVVAETKATTGGGTVTLQADGDFTFTPASATSCTSPTDSFTYTVSDQDPTDPRTGTGTVTIDLSGCVWYVSNNATGNAGTSVAPFDTLAQAEAASSAGDTIYLYDGDNTTTGYSAGITLKANQQLLGEAATLQVGSDVLAAAVPANRPTITDNNADVVDLGSGNTVRGVQIDPQGTGGGIAGGADDAGGTIDDVRIVDTGTAGTQPALELDGTTGTFDISSLTVDSSAATGTTSGSIGVRLNNAGTVNFAASGTISITTTGAKALEASSTSLGAGSVLDSVTVTGSGSGAVSMSTTSGTTTFGNLSLTTTSGATGAFVLNSAGAVTVSGAGTANVSATGGPAVDVSGTSGPTLDFDSVSSTNSSGSAISLAGLGSGSFTATGGTLSGATGTAFAVSGSGSGTVTYAGAIGDGTGNTASITGRTGGTLTLSGILSDGADANGGIAITSNSGGSTVLSGSAKTFSTGSGTAVNLGSNTGHTVSITGGGLAITSTSGNGLSVSGGGTVNVSGTGNTISTGTGSGLLIDNSTIGASNVTFEKISSNGAPVGIRANNTGASGRLVVTGSGGTCTNADTSGCSGGTIANGVGGDDSGTTPGGTGIVLNSTLNPSFTRMWVHDHSNYAIRGTDVAGFTLASSVVNGANGDNGTSPFDDSSVLMDNLTGSAAVTDTYVSGGFEDNFRVVNTSGSLNRITFTNDTFGSNGARPSNDAVLLETSSAASQLQATVTASTFTSAGGDLLQFNHNGSGAGDLVLSGNAFSNDNTTIANGGGGLTLSSDGAGGDTTMDITGNTFRDAVGNALTIIKTTGAATQTGTFANNTIGVSGIDNSGSEGGDGLKIQTVGQGTLTWTVTNNQIHGYNNFGVDVLAGGSATAQSGTVNATVTNNTIDQPGTLSGIPMNGVHLNIGTVPLDTYQACAQITGNSLATSGALGGDDIRVRQRQSTTVRLPGYGGANNDNAAVAAFLVAANPNGGPTALASNNVPTGGGFTGGGTTCP